MHESCRIFVVYSVVGMWHEVGLGERKVGKFVEADVPPATSDCSRIPRFFLLFSNSGGKVVKSKPRNSAKTHTTHFYIIASCHSTTFAPDSCLESKSINTKFHFFTPGL